MSARTGSLDQAIGDDVSVLAREVDSRGDCLFVLNINPNLE